MKADRADHTRLWSEVATRFCSPSRPPMPLINTEKHVSMTLTGLRIYAAGTSVFRYMSRVFSTWKRLNDPEIKLYIRGSSLTSLMFQRLTKGDRLFGWRTLCYSAQPAQATASDKAANALSSHSSQYGYEFCRMMPSLQSSLGKGMLHNVFF